MKLLVIEDEFKAAEYLRKGLIEEGYAVELALNGVDGLHMASVNRYDMLIVDGVLPGIDGLAVIAAIRQSSDVPILMVSARSGVEDRIRGLQGGADDYLVKPYAFSELVARIQVLLRRRPASRQALEDAIYRVGDLEVDPIRRRVVRAGRRVDLSIKEFGLLTLLTRRAGEVLSRTEIAEFVWDTNFESDANVVEVAIRRLRMKIDEPFDRPLLHTVRGMGYVLEDRPMRSD